MQDRYTGDVGDFGKYGLLRWLSGLTAGDEAPRLRLGVVWYLAYPEDNDDGEKTEYLSDGGPATRPCDPELWDGLKRIIDAQDRRVARIRHEGLLGNADFYEEPLGFGDFPPHAREARIAHREAWVQAAISATEDSDLVFLDPDNGLQPASTKRHHRAGPKFVYYDEADRLCRPGQSLVVYHHLGRTKSHRDQIVEVSDRLRQEVGCETILALRFRTRIPRAYLIAAGADHAGLLTSRTQSLLRSGWCRHFERVL